MIDYEGDESTGHGSLSLPKGESGKALRDGIKLFKSFRDCNTRIEELDDESYLWDGVPFPNATLQTPTKVKQVLRERYAVLSMMENMHSDNSL